MWSIDEEYGQEQEGLEFQEEESDIYLDLMMSNNSSISDHPPDGIDFNHKCSTPMSGGNHVRGVAANVSSSSRSSLTQGQHLPSPPVPGSHNSSSSRSSMTDSHQLPSAPLPGSTHPSTSSDREASTFSLPGHLSGQSEVSSGSVSKACTCNCNCEQVSSRLQQLEQKLADLMTVQPQTPRSIPRKPPLSAQKHEHVGEGKRGDRLYGKFSFPF